MGRVSNRQKQLRKAVEAAKIARRKRRAEKQADIELARVKRRKSDPKGAATIALIRQETITTQLQSQRKESVQSLTASQLYFKQLRRAQTGSEDDTKDDVKESTQCKLEPEEINGFDKMEDEKAVPLTQLKLRIIPPPKPNKKRKLVTKETPPGKPAPPPPPKNCFVCRRLLNGLDASLITRSQCFFLLTDLLGLSKEQAALHLRQFCRYDTWLGLCPLCHPLIQDGTREREEVRKLEASIKKRQQTFLIRFKPERTFRNGEMNPALENIRNVIRIKGQSSTLDLVSVSPAECENESGRLEDPSLDESPLSPAENGTLTPSTILNCGVCTEGVYSSEAELQSHTEEAHPLNPSEEDSEELQLPVRQLEPTRFYKCPSCPEVQRYDINEIAQHLAIHRRLPFKCSVCQIFLAADEDLQEQHWTDKHPDVVMLPALKFRSVADVVPGRFWKCDGCSKTFIREAYRDAHEQNCPEAKAIQEGPFPFSCGACKKPLRTFNQWRLHRVIHHPEMDRISCLYCDTAFGGEGESRDEEKMLMHIRDHHEPEYVPGQWAKSFFVDQILEECEPCGLVFPSGKHAQSHFREKHGESDGRVSLFSCPVCRKGFDKRENLVGHAERNHFLEESICDLCGESFKGLTKLLDHRLRVHDSNPGEEHPVYACEEPGCQFKTVVKGKLITHSKMVHAPHGSFKCKYCGKGFKNSAHVKEHERIHENKESKPYQCEICGNSFAMKNYLYIHKRLSHEGRIFPSTNKKKTPRKEKKNPIPRPGRLEERNELNGASSEGASCNNANDSVDCATEVMSLKDAKKC